VLHELYFETLAQGLACKKSSLFNEIAAQNFQDGPEWKNNFIETALRRGIGWAVTLFEPETRRLFNHWIVGDEPDPALDRFKPVLVLDMWEHAYILDYTPSERLNYIGAFFQNINWGVIENRLKEV
jgi:Fe-Mn family superoxide dismutase